MYHQYTDLLNQISEEELRQLVDDENVGSIVQSPPNAAMGRITANGNKAQFLIDGYCRGRYRVPLSPVPDLIKELSVELTVYFCMSRKKEIALSEEQSRRYKNSIALLDHIQDGKILLQDNVGNAHYITNKNADDRRFPAQEMDRF
jgi:phage gp36-like protein